VITNKRYAKKLVNPDGSVVSVKKYFCFDPELVDLSLNADENELIITSKDKIGKSKIEVEDIYGNKIDFPVIVDEIDFTYEYYFENKKINDDGINGTIYSTNSKKFSIKQHAYSKVYERELTELELDNYAKFLFFVDKNDEKINIVDAGDDYFSIQLLKDDGDFDLKISILTPDNKYIEKLFNFEIKNEISLIQKNYSNGNANNANNVKDSNKNANNANNVNADTEQKISDLTKPKLEQQTIGNKIEVSLTLNELQKDYVEFDIIKNPNLNIEFIESENDENLDWNLKNTTFSIKPLYYKDENAIIKFKIFDKNDEENYKILNLNINVEQVDFNILPKSEVNLKIEKNNEFLIEYMMLNSDLEYKIYTTNEDKQNEKSITKNGLILTEIDETNIETNITKINDYVGKFDIKFNKEFSLDNNPLVVIFKNKNEYNEKETYLNIQVVKELVLKLENPNDIEVLGTPAKIRFENASNIDKSLFKVVAYDEISGSLIKVKTEYDIDPYSKKEILSSGYIYAYPLKISKFKVIVCDGFNSESVEFESKNEKNFDALNSLIAIIPKYEDENVSGDLNLKVDLENTKIKNGTLIGEQWIDDKKRFGKYKLKKIKYAVTFDITKEVHILDWLKSIEGTKSQVKIDIRDGLLLLPEKKEFIVNSYQVEKNIFETEDLSKYNILIEDSETILFTDINHRPGMSVKNDENKKMGIIINEEKIYSRIKQIPVASYELETIEKRKMPPLSKPCSCLDIKRLNPDAQNGKYIIYPSTKEDIGISVDCIFDENDISNTQTKISSSSLKVLFDLIGKGVAYDNTPIKIESMNGVHPQLYPSKYDSLDKPSYGILTFPYKIKEISFKINERIEEENNSFGIFKIFGETSDIYNIEGSENNYLMDYRNGDEKPFDEKEIEKNIGQIYVSTDECKGYYATKNAPEGNISFEDMGYRIAISNSGSINGYGVAEFYLNEITFKNEFNVNDYSDELWIPKHNDFDIKMKYVLKTTPTQIISFESEKIVSLEEHINLSMKNHSNIISLKSTPITEISNNNVSFKQGIIQKNITFVDNEINEFKLDGVVKKYKNNFIVSNINSKITDFNIVDQKSSNNNIMFGRDDLDYIVSVKKSEVMELNELKYKFYDDKTRKNIISNKVSNILEIPTQLKLSTEAYKTEIISDTKSNLIDINEFIEIVPNIRWNIENKKSEINELNNDIVVNGNIRWNIENKKSEINEFDNFVNIKITGKESFVVTENIDKIDEIAPKYEIKVYHPELAGLKETEINFIVPQYSFEIRRIPFTIYENATKKDDNVVIEVQKTDFPTMEFDKNDVVYINNQITNKGFVDIHNVGERTQLLEVQKTDFPTMKFDKNDVAYVNNQITNKGLVDIHNVGERTQLLEVQKTDFSTMEIKGTVEKEENGEYDEIRIITTKSDLIPEFKYNAENKAISKEQQTIVTTKSDLIPEFEYNAENKVISREQQTIVMTKSDLIPEFEYNTENKVISKEQQTIVMTKSDLIPEFEYNVGIVDVKDKEWIVDNNSANVAEFTYSKEEYYFPPKMVEIETIQIENGDNENYEFAFNLVDDNNNIIKNASENEDLIMINNSNEEIKL
jgi:hypothetical protein